MQVTTEINPERPKEIAKALSKIWSETHALRLRTRDFQRRLRGPICAALQLLLGEQQDELRRAEAVLAKRIREVRGPTPTGMGPAETSTFDRGNCSAKAVDERVVCLVEAHEAAARAALNARRLAERAGDLRSSKLLEKRADAHEKAAWTLVPLGVGSTVWCEVCAERFTCPLSTVRLQKGTARGAGGT